MEWVTPLLVVGFALAILGTVSRTQDRLLRTEHKLNALLRHFNIDLTQGIPLSDQVKELARDKGKISAIKVYRQETGASLVEAKAAVEAYMDSL
jgi:hypothetical protein